MIVLLLLERLCTGKGDAILPLCEMIHMAFKGNGISVLHQPIIRQW